MPTVGGRKFEYSEEGIAEAEAYAKKMGLPMPKFDKPTSKKEKQRMVDAGNYEAIAEENAGKNMGGRIKGYMKGGRIKGSGKKSPVKKNMGGKVMGYKSGGMMEGPDGKMVETPPVDYEMSNSGKKRTRRGPSRQDRFENSIMNKSEGKSPAEIERRPVKKKSPVKKKLPVKKNMGGPIKGYMGGGGVTADRGNGIAQKGIRRCKMT